MNEQRETIQLSERTREQIEHWLKKYPAEQKQSAVIPALHIVQKENNGWLTEALMNAVADYLEMPKIAVYEVATFYSMYDLEPVGKTKINVCTNVSCMLAGSDKVVAHLQKRLKIKLGESTADKKYALKEVECLGACVGAPMMHIDDHYYENLTPEKIDNVLNELEKTNGK